MISVGKKKNKRKININDRIFNYIVAVVVTVLTIAVLYPIVYILSASFSSSTAVAQGKVWLLPVDLSLKAYEAVLGYSDLWLGYRNTIFYVIVGTIINVAMTMICAYPMARRDLWGRKSLSFFFTFTMLFSGGMIPNYILVKNLGMLNTVWALMLPGAMSVYNMIVARTYIESNIPHELLESSRIDGCNDVNFFFRMVLPLSKAIIAVLALWYAVGHWNSYFSAFLYLTEKELYPLQIFLKEILVQSEFNTEMLTDVK